MSSGPLESLRQAMEGRVQRRELPGLVYLVAHDNDVHVESIGCFAYDSEPLMQRDTIFRIASMTKPILATATMQLVEDGRVRLDEPVDRLLPELANRRVLRRVEGPIDDTVPANRPVTVEDLLTFVFGFGMVFEPSLPVLQRADELQLVMGRPDPRTPLDPDEWIRRFGTLPLMYQPGERWLYNAGSLVLGVLVARAAGQPLGDFFASRIFEPLGMRETGFVLPAKDVGRMPAYYMNDQLQSLSPPSEWATPPPFPSGAGGLVSTVDDYLAFARCMLRGGSPLVNAGSVRLMTTNHLTPEQIASAGPILSGQGWGYAMSVSVQPDETSPTPGRYGWAGGYGTLWFNDPHRDLVAILMTQTSDTMWNGGFAEFSRLAGQV